MASNKSSNLSLKGRDKKNKMVLIIVILMTLIIGITSIYNYQRKNNIIDIQDVYYKGDLYTANQAANMLDYLDDNNNLIISPINVNTSLAILYNGTDNNSSKELKRYFKKTQIQVNEEMNYKLSNLTSENPTKNAINKVYESLIEELNNKQYNTLTTQTISLLSEEKKEDLILLLRKIEISYNVINNKSNYSKKNIKNYQLTQTELSYNNYTIKEMLDDTLSNYEHYNIINEVNNYTGIYINNLNRDNIEDSFITKTYLYNYNLTCLNHSTNTEKIQAINDDIKTATYGTINRIIESHDIGENEVVVTNNLNFNYSWEIPFNHKHIKDAEFYNSDNEVQAVEMMYTEQTTYLENTHAKGFKYNFKNNKYSFIGILPKETDNFKLSSLDINSLLLSNKEGKVLIGIPKMNYSSEVDIKELVSNYSINEIFTDKANFTKITEDKIYISRMTQKNNLTIAEKGTIKSNIKQSEIPKIDTSIYTEELILNRPYAYLIINNETNDILFIGKVVRINEGS